METRYKLLIGFVVLMLIIRLILPYVGVRYANTKLAHLPGHYGHIKSMHLKLYRGSCTINDFYLNKVDTTSKEQTELFKLGALDLSIEWAALLRRSIVGSLALHSPSLFLSKESKIKSDGVKKDPAELTKLLKSIMPIRIKRFEIHDGTLSYADSTSEPKVDVSIKKIHILATNLTNVTSKNVELPSTVNAQAEVYEGVFDLRMKLNVPAENPTFDLDAELKGTNLVLLNDFFKAYGKFNVTKGNFGLYTEMAAKEGKFVGYAKPVIKDLEVARLQGPNASTSHKIWGALVGAVAGALKNQKKDQLATKIPVEGAFSDPKLNIFYAVWEVLQNAFVQALTSSIDNKVNMNSIKIDKASGGDPSSAR